MRRHLSPSLWSWPLASLAASLILGSTVAFGVAHGGADEFPEEAMAGTIHSLSYGLFPVAGSDVRGRLNVIERLEGGSRFVVTLVGIEVGAQYLPVLFSGDCGPDRARVMELPAVGSMVNDPFVSISDVEMSFQEVSAGDYFLYIYRGSGPEAEAGEPISCGEVGVGANR